MADRTLTDPVPRVLVKEKIGAMPSFCAASSRSSLLDWADGELAERRGLRGDPDRSGTAYGRPLIDRADRLRVIGRAGTGVDNVDIEAATKRGIIVANAPSSNSVAAAEHTLAMALALHRNVPQAHGSLVAGQWERPGSAATSST